MPMVDPKQLDALARRYGEPQRVRYDVKIRTPGFAEWTRKLTRRRGEVILVVPRRAGRVLLHTKPHYPEGVFRLPTGGIHEGEAADVAARREAFEELGYDLESMRLLGVLEHVFEFNGAELHYPSFVFRTEFFSAEPAPTDAGEPISGFSEANAQELRAVAAQLRALPAHWREWGRFRAIAHSWLAERI
jgi:8-oxo-dGTP pyrophosphatase MutT (NUDIX family)